MFSIIENKSILLDQKNNIYIIFNDDKNNFDL